jgi:RHS repeat-associated protein
MTATKAYEAHRDLLASIENKSGATTVSRYEYANDAAGRRAQAGWTGTAFAGQPDSIAYGYNLRNEVTAANATNRAQYLFGYGYDPIGNRQQSSAGDPPAATAYTANSLNQYTAISGRTSPVCDNDGNMTLMPSLTGDWALSWDGENRLVRAESAATRLDFVYDHQSRRIGKTKFARDGEAWVLAEESRFIYDGWNMVECGALVGGAWACTQAYIWGLDLSGTPQGAGGIGGLLARHDVATNATQYYTFDGNGNVSELLDDATGAIAAHYEYDPFGNAFTATGPLAALNPYRFSTKYLDVETGLYYYGMRYLNTPMGRWGSRDPIGERGGPNLYAFVINQIFSLVDPTGSRCTTVIYAGHADEADRYIGQPRPPSRCDRLGTISCWPDDRNREIDPGYQIPGLPGAFDDLLDEHGRLSCANMREALDRAIGYAEIDARMNQCRSEAGGCCDRVRFSVQCSTVRRWNFDRRTGWYRQRSAAQCAPDLCNRIWIMSCN